MINKLILTQIIAMALTGISWPKQEKASQKADNRPPYYYAGGNASLSFRKGSYEFSDFELSSDTARDNLFLFGFNFGKRRSLSPLIRLNIGGIFNFGGVYEDTLETGASAYLVRHRFFHMGFEPEIQITGKTVERLTPFIGIGGGINFMRFREEFFTYDKYQQINFTPESRMEPRDEKKWRPHVHAACGFDLFPRTDIGISVKYSLRYWIPVDFEDSRDLPLQSIRYHERFLTHMLQLQLLMAVER